jgi:mono/diheme cytochrome c family protein
VRLMAFMRRSEVPFNALRRGKRVVAPLTKFALAALLATPCVAQTRETGNVEAGHAYAKKVCAECHAVERGENDYLNPPSFQMVADSPGITERALAVWLRNPHPNMPNFILPQADMENVIAYIMSLKSTSR